MTSGEEIKSDDGETVVLFDWDDTLIATTHLRQLQVVITSPDGIKDPKLKQLIADTEILLKNLFDKNKNVLFYIVTNADKDWVILCLELYPSLKEIIGKKIEVISAKEKFEKLFPDNHERWKHEAYCEILTTLGPKITNVVGLGDRMFDRSALLKLHKTGKKIKSLKLVESPTAEHLYRQLCLVCNCFEYIVKHNGNLDLQLTISFNTTVDIPKEDENEKKEKIERINDIF
jgi:hypothetical protein